jgi:serine kinase of HPr protein (carbohydrate metabolism regulator)
MSPAANVHGTAIVIGTTGIIFMGPSGCGKSAAALHCIGQARNCGYFAALVADDQVMLSVSNGSIIGRAPRSIAGMAEMRGSDVVQMDAISCAIIQRIVRPVRPPFSERVSPEAETQEILPDHSLPVTRLPIEEGFDCYIRLTQILPFLLKN